MDERASRALDKLRASSNYACVCPDTVARVFEQELGRHKTLKLADKAARARLHIMTGAFMTREDIKRALKAMDEYASGDMSALERILSAHASTRERLIGADALYDRVFKLIGVPESVFDAACGLNPIYLGARGLKRVLGADIHSGCVDLINEISIKLGWDVRALWRDITINPMEARADLALFMKLMPVLEAQSAGAGLNALKSVNSKYLLITFPTRTLCGRGVGMEAHYTRWMDARADEIGKVLDRFICASELVYLIERSA